MEPLGVAVVVAMAFGAFAYGLAIIRDWRGLGSRIYGAATRLPLPGAGFYRDWGYGTFRAIVGGGSIVVSLLWIVIVVVAVVHA